jgi:hypothetical protein
MAEQLSTNARRILMYLYDEKDLSRRTADAVCTTLSLSRADWEAAQAELCRYHMLAQHDERSYKLTPRGTYWVEQARRQRASITVHGDVGAGAVVGSGRVTAGNIAGGDIQQGYEIPSRLPRRQAIQRSLTQNAAALFIILVVTLGALVLLLGKAGIIEIAGITPAEDEPGGEASPGYLFSFDEQGEPAPGIVAGWEGSEDGTVWTFDIMEGLRFPDGAPFTAEAVAEAFRAARDQSPGLDEIQVIDDLTVQLSFTTNDFDAIWAFVRDVSASTPFELTG